MRLKASNPQRASQAVLHAQCPKASNPQRASQAVLHTLRSKASNPQRASQAVLHNLNVSRSDTCPGNHHETQSTEVTHISRK